MRRDLVLVFAVFAMGAAPIAGQTYERRATLSGSSTTGQGKCTVEVVVDGSADVEIRGDRGFLRNLTGQTPQWRRFDCTGVLPTNATDFRFAGVDGRGTQQLVSDPRNGGVAVVRITDPQGGSHGYTFDITWSGGSTYSNQTSSPSIFDDGSGNNGRNNGRNNRNRISTDEAIRLCQDSVRQQAVQRYSTSDIEFRRTIIEENRGGGNRDLIAGAFVVRNATNVNAARPEVHRFSCSINFNNGRIQSVQLDPQQRPGSNNQQRGGAYNTQDGLYSDQAVSNVGVEATQACQKAVTDRIRRDGAYQRFAFGRMNMENGENVVGSVTADRGNISESFDYVCSVAANTGRVRSVQVNRR